MHHICLLSPPRAILYTCKCIWVTSHVNESRHICLMSLSRIFAHTYIYMWTSHITYEWVTPHKWVISHTCQMSLRRNFLHTCIYIWVHIRPRKKSNMFIWIDVYFMCIYISKCIDVYLKKYMYLCNYTCIHKPMKTCMLYIHIRIYVYVERYTL